MAVSGSFLNLAEAAARMARFDVDDSDDMDRAKEAINDAYMSTCASGDNWDFCQREGQWLTTAGSDTYSYSSITTAMSITGAEVAEILSLTDDDSTDGEYLRSMSWDALERFASSSQDGESQGDPLYWSKWERRIRLFPCPDSERTIGTYCRLVPTEMSGDTDEPLVPMAWRRRLLVPFAAAVLIRTEGGLEANSEASRLMDAYDNDFVKFRTAYATAKRPTFNVSSPGWESADFPGESPSAAWWLT